MPKLSGFEYFAFKKKNTLIFSNVFTNNKKESKERALQ